MDVVISEIVNRVGHITLNRPDKRNALNSEMVALLTDSIRKFSSNEEVKVILLKAKGDSFCAGADLEYLKALQINSFEENLADSNRLKDMFTALYTSPKVTVSMVNGSAVAGGCGLATNCDFCFASTGSVFGYSEVRIGFIPAIVSSFLIRKIGEGAARELLLSAKMISADEAKAIHLINNSVAESELESYTLSFIEKICTETSGDAIAMTKALMRDYVGLTNEEALDLAAIRNAEARATKECKKGIQSFLDKKKRSW